MAEFYSSTVLQFYKSESDRRPTLFLESLSSGSSPEVAAQWITQLQNVLRAVVRIAMPSAWRG